MKKNIFFIFLVLFTSLSIAQNSIKKVVVETYYISDENDAADTIGGHLEPGSKTYRIYIQLAPGAALTKMYGDARHALKFSSTSNFFNNSDRGKTFAKDISKSNYYNNTVALDTWLTLGQTTKKSVNTYFGILKSKDSDGSFIGGANNDGGSLGSYYGLLANNNPIAGLPLTMADGMATLANVPTNWIDYGFTDLTTGEDSTIFGSVKSGNSFISNNAYLQNSGVMGVLADSNWVLVAQLTTKGDISFELNVEVKDDNGTIKKYVATGKDTLDEIVFKQLKFPPECGCMDPNYIEYRNDFQCNISDSCKTRIVLGCMDVNACNYNKFANINVPSLCCYPGLCADRDISLVCQLQENNIHMRAYPNPAGANITFEITANKELNSKYELYNSFGKFEYERKISVLPGINTFNLDLSQVVGGMYLVRFFDGNEMKNITFIKE